MPSTSSSSTARRSMPRSRDAGAPGNKAPRCSLLLVGLVAAAYRAHAPRQDAALLQANSVDKSVAIVAAAMLFFPADVRVCWGHSADGCAAGPSVECRGARPLHPCLPLDDVAEIGAQVLCNGLERDWTMDIWPRGSRAGPQSALTTRAQKWVTCKVLGDYGFTVSFGMLCATPPSEASSCPWCSPLVVSNLAYDGWVAAGHPRLQVLP